MYSFFFFFPKTVVVLSIWWSGKALSLTSSHGHTKITTNCWTAIDKKGRNLPKQIVYIWRHKEVATRCYEGCTCKIINPLSAKGSCLAYGYAPCIQWVVSVGECEGLTPWVGPTHWRIIILQTLSHRSESPFPNPRVWHWEEELPRALGYEGQQGLIAGAPQGRGRHT